MKSKMTLLFIICSGGGCVVASERIEDKNKLFAIADDAIHIKYPKFDLHGKRHELIDKGDTWEVSFELSSDQIGGAPVVVIYKNILSVKSVFHTQ